MSRLMIKSSRWRIKYGIIVLIIGIYFNYSVFSNDEIASTIDFFLIFISAINFSILGIGIFWILTSINKIEIDNENIYYLTKSKNQFVKWETIEDLHLQFNGKNNIFSGFLDTSFLGMFLQLILTPLFFGFNSTGKLIINITTSNEDHKFKIYSIPTIEIKNIIENISIISNIKFEFSDLTTEKQKNEFQFWNWTLIKE